MKNLWLLTSLLAILVSSLFFSYAYSQSVSLTTNTIGNNQTINTEWITPHSNFNPFQKNENQSHLIIPRVHLYNSSLFPKAKFSLVKIQTKPLTTISIANSPMTAEVNQPLTVNLNHGFNGLDETTSGGYVPPDVQIAVGPSHVVEFVNLEGEIWTKQGTSLSTFSLWSFFTVGISHAISDPKILYDSSSGRWFASLLDTSTDTVVLAVSTTNDPTVTGWHIYNITSFSNCPDQPILGISNDKIVVSGNDFTNNCSGSFVGAQYIVLDKTEAVAGTTVSAQSFSPDLTKLSIHPVQSLSSTSTLYLVSTDQSSLNHIQLFSITGTVPNTIVSTSNLSIASFRSPPRGVQPGTLITIDTSDNRISDAKWYQNKLWFSFDDGCTPSGDTQVRSCVRIVQIDTSSTTITQDMEIGTSGIYYYYPALSIDSLGNLAIIFGYSSSTIYPSLAVTEQTTTDTANTLEQSIILVSGSADDTSGRYGDYFGAASDPSIAKVWISGEYNTASTWSTFIGSTAAIFPLTESVSISDSIQISKTSGCAPPLSGDWTITRSCTLTSTSTAPANVIVQSGTVLTIPNGLKLNIDFIHHHLLVKAGGGVLIKAGGAIN